MKRTDVVSPRAARRVKFSIAKVNACRAPQIESRCRRRRRLRSSCAASNRRRPAADDQGASTSMGSNSVNRAGSLVVRCCSLIGILPFTAPALAAVCHIPTAVLCEGCVTNLSIRVAPNGLCRISFTPAPTTANEGSGASIEIEIKAEPNHSVPRPNVVHPRIGNRTAPLRASAPCFVFNNRKFCE